MIELKPMLLELRSLYEIETEDGKEKYVVTGQGGTQQFGVIEVTLRPLIKGKGDIIIRFLGKSITQP